MKILLGFGWLNFQSTLFRMRIPFYSCEDPKKFLNGTGVRLCK